MEGLRSGHSNLSNLPPRPHPGFPYNGPPPAKFHEWEADSLMTSRIDNFVADENSPGVLLGGSSRGKFLPRPLYLSKTDVAF